MPSALLLVGVGNETPGCKLGLAQTPGPLWERQLVHAGTNPGDVGSRGQWASQTHKSSMMIPTEPACRATMSTDAVLQRLLFSAVNPVKHLPLAVSQLSGAEALVWWSSHYQADPLLKDPHLINKSTTLCKKVTFGTLMTGCL